MKRRNAVPAIPPFVDPWGKPTYENPLGQNRPNPALTAFGKPVVEARLVAENGVRAQPAVRAHPDRLVEPQRVPRVPLRRREAHALSLGARVARGVQRLAHQLRRRDGLVSVSDALARALVVGAREQSRQAELSVARTHGSGRRSLRRHTAVVAIALASLGVATAVFAYFTATGSGVGGVTVATFPAPANVAANASGSTVHVTWTGVTDPGSGTFGYYVQRFAGSSPSAACGSSPASLLPATPTACDDTSVADGTYTYEVTAVYNSFSATSSASDPITVASDTTAPTVSAPNVSAATTFGSNPVFVNNEPVNLTDTASDGGGSGVHSVAYFYCVGASGSCTSSNWVSIGSTTTSAGNWPVTWSPLPGDGAYQVVAQGTDNATNVSDPSNATLVSVDTTAPTVSAPVLAAAVTSGANPVFVDNETVNLSDAVSDAGGSGVQSVAYFYCAGSAGACSGGTPIGTSTTAAGNFPVAWATPLPTDGPYRIVAVATDNIGNTNSSSDPTAVTVDKTGPTVPNPKVNGFS
jgi:hypothetical protein